MATVFGDSIRAVQVKNVVTLDRNRAAFFPVPRSVFASPPHTLIRFGLLNDSLDRQAHWNDMIVYSFFANLLQDSEVIKYVQDVYYTTKPLDGASEDYVWFVAVFKGREVTQIASRGEDLCNINGLRLGLCEIVAEPAAEEGGEGGTAGRGRGRGGGKSAPKKAKVDTEASELKRARLVTDYAPGYDPVCIRELKSSITKFTGGVATRNLGALIASKEDLGARLKLWYLSRGLEVVGGAAVMAPAHADGEFDEDGALEEDGPETEGALYGSVIMMRTCATMKPAEEEGEPPVYVPAGEPFPVQLSLRYFMDYFTNKAHSALNIVPHGMSNRNGNTLQQMDPTAASALMFRVINPMAEIGALYMRTESCTEMYERWSAYTARQMFNDSSSIEQNKVGDSNMLATFCMFEGRDIVQRGLDGRAQAASLVYDVLSTSRRLPSSLAAVLRDFNEDLSVNGGIPFKPRNVEVASYKNLSYSANFVLHLMQQFEELGMYYFHCSALNVLMTVACTGFRPVRSVGNNNVTPESMCCHFLLYGAQGVGKSHLMEMMKSIYPGFFNSITYTSLRASFGAMDTDDATDNTAIFSDEAAAWKVGGEMNSGSRPEDNDRVVQEKEILSSGTVTCRRLVQMGKDSPMAVVTYTSSSHHAPKIELTNAAPGRGNIALLDRYRWMYLQRMKRLLKHVHQVDPNAINTGVAADIVAEMKRVHVLCVILSKMQECGIVPWPHVEVFRSFVSNLAEQTVANPYLDCAPLDMSDRKKMAMELIFINLVNRMVITRHFVEDDGDFTGKPFDPVQMVTLDRYMGVGDIQMAIFAAGYAAHELVSPVHLEVRKRLINLAEVKATPDQDDGCSFSVDTSLLVPQLVVSAGEDSHHVTISKEFLDNTSPAAKADLQTNYVMIDKLVVGKQHRFCKEDNAKVLAEKLKSAENYHELMPAHTQRKLEELNTQTVRCGPMAGKVILLFLQMKGSSDIGVWALKDWLLEHYLQQWTFKSMVQKALLSNKLTPPGRYLVLEPLHVGSMTDSLGYQAHHDNFSAWCNGEGKEFVQQTSEYANGKAADAAKATSDAELAAATAAASPASPALKAAAKRAAETAEASSKVAAEAKMVANRAIIAQYESLYKTDAVCSVMVNSNNARDAQTFQKIFERKDGKYVNGNLYVPNACNFVDLPYHAVADDALATGAAQVCKLHADCMDLDGSQKDASRDAWFGAQHEPLRPLPEANGEKSCFCFRKFLSDNLGKAKAGAQLARGTFHGTLEYDVPAETLGHRHFVERNHPNIAKRLRAPRIRGVGAEGDSSEDDEEEAAPDPSLNLAVPPSAIVPHPRLFGIADREAGVKQSIYPDDFLTSIYRRNSSSRFGKGVWNENDKAHERAIIAYEKSQKASQDRKRAEAEQRERQTRRDRAARGGAGAAGPA